MSFNGHTWSTAGINSGWNEQQWQINYSTKNFTYDSEGRNNEIYPIEHNQSDVDTPQGGYIWDSVAAAGKTIGMYGEYCDNPLGAPQTLTKGDPLPAFLAHARRGLKSPFPWKIPVYADLDSKRQGTGWKHSDEDRVSRLVSAALRRLRSVVSGRLSFSGLEARF